MASASRGGAVNAAGARGFGDRHGHEPDDAHARDQHGLGAHPGAHHGVHRVAQRVEDRRVLVGDVRVHGPDIVLGDDDVVGEAPVAVDAEDGCIAGDVRVAGA